LTGVLEIKTTQPVLHYDFVFKWEIVAMFFEKVKGKGKASATCKNLEVRVTLKDGKLSSEVKADFDVKLDGLYGDFDNDIKKMANQNLIEWIKKGFNSALDLNKGFIEQYLFFPYLNLSYNQHKGKTVVYESRPVG
jgi:hypothetical protein